MKKLITAAVASAFAFLAIGAVNAVDLPSGTSVESYTGALRTDKNDAGTEAASTYWFLQGDENAELLVTNYVVTPYQPRPEQFTGDNNNYLKIDTTGRLYRSIGVNDQTTTFGNTVDIGDGIYLDTLVQFTAADDQFKADAITGGDKIAIEYVENEEEGYTNFVVRAAYVDAANSTIVATNYFLTFPGQPANEVQFDKSAWHRLTVRAISNVGNTYAPVGFVVYVDGTNLVYNASVAAGDADYVESLNSVVQTYLYNSETHSLLPSLMTSDDIGYDALAAVAFNGNGCVDDISFTATKPGILPVEGTAVTIAWDANVATYTVVAGETTLIDGETVSGAGSTNLLLAAEVTAVTVTATYAENYEPGKWTVTGQGAEISGNTFTVAPGAQLNIVSMYPYFQVGETHYGTVAAAVEAAVGQTEGQRGTLKLLNNFVGTITTPYNGFLTIDLAGKTLTGTDVAPIFNAGVDLIITNSTVEVGRVVPGERDVIDEETQEPTGVKEPTETVVLSAGITTIFGGRYEGEVFDDTGVEGSLYVYGGQFLDIYSAETVDAFYLKVSGYVPSEVNVEYKGNYYFQVGSDTPEPPTPTSVEVPTAETGLVYDGTEQTGVAAGTGYTLGGTYAATNAGEYEATATPDTGYAWSDGTTHTTNISWSIAKATVTATVSLTVTEATYDSTKTTVTDYTTPSLNFGLGAPALVENTDYTVGWSATEVSGAGTFTYTVSPVAESNYTFTEASVTLTITAGSSYPSYIDPTDTEETAKYTAWATYAEVSDVATGEVNEEAYLLNCKPSEVAAAKAAFKFTSISYDSTQSKWVTPTTTSYNNRDYNGEIVVKQYSDVGCTTESSTGTFFKAVLQ